MELNELLDDITGGDDYRAESTVHELASFGAEALPSLEEMLTNPDPDKRWWATRTLAEIQHPRVADLLLVALRDPDTSVRQCAALALCYHPDSRVVTELVALLDGQDRLLARLAADALVAVGRDAVPQLLDIMNHGPQISRLEAVRALASIGDHQSIPALFAALDEDSALMEYWASEGLERMGFGMTFFNLGR